MVPRPHPSGAPSKFTDSVLAGALSVQVQLLKSPTAASLLNRPLFAAAVSQAEVHLGLEHPHIASLHRVYETDQEQSLAPPPQRPRTAPQSSCGEPPTVPFS